MIWHEQAGNDFAVQDMPFHNFRDVGFSFHTVPDAFWIHDYARSLRTMVKTACLVRADNIFQIQPFRFRLEARMQRFGSQL